VRSLDEFLPVHEFSERHRIEVDAPRDRIDRAVRDLSLHDIPVARALWAMRRLGRSYGEPDRPFFEAGIAGSTVLDDVPGEGLVLGLTGRFWKLRDAYVPAPRTREEFLAYSRPEVCKAVIDVRIEPPFLTTETRVHVGDPAARRKFARYWRVIRPFSGLIRILMLRAAKRRAEAA
jgi:hypothetical protein